MRPRRWPGCKSQLAGLLAHEHAPLALAQQASGVIAPAPLFTTLLNYRHNPAVAPQTGSRLAGIEVLSIRERTNYPVTVSVDDFGSGSGFGFTVLAVAPVDAGQVCGLLRTVTEGLIRVLEEDHVVPLRQVPVLEEAERRQVVSGWNDTARGCSARDVAGVVRGAGGAGPGCGGGHR